MIGLSNFSGRLCIPGLTSKCDLEKLVFISIRYPMHYVVNYDEDKVGQPGYASLEDVLHLPFKIRELQEEFRRKYGDDYSFYDLYQVLCLSKKYLKEILEMGYGHLDRYLFHQPTDLPNGVEGEALIEPRYFVCEFDLESDLISEAALSKLFVWGKENNVQIGLKIKDPAHVTRRDGLDTPHIRLDMTKNGTWYAPRIHFRETLWGGRQVTIGGHIPLSDIGAALTCFNRASHATYNLWVSSCLNNRGVLDPQIVESYAIKCYGTAILRQKEAVRPLEEDEMDEDGEPLPGVVLTTVVYYEMVRDRTERASQTVPLKDREKFLQDPPPLGSTAWEDEPLYEEELCNIAT